MKALNVSLNLGVYQMMMVQLYVIVLLAGMAVPAAHVSTPERLSHILLHKSIFIYIYIT